MFKPQPVITLKTIKLLTIPISSDWYMSWIWIYISFFLSSSFNNKFSTIICISTICHKCFYWCIHTMQGNSCVCLHMICRNTNQVYLLITLNISVVFKARRELDNFLTGALCIMKVYWNSARLSFFLVILGKTIVPVIC